MGKDGSIWQLLVLCLLALGDSVPQCYFLTIVWDTLEKEKVAKWSSAPASILEGFNQIEGQQTLQNWVKNTILPNGPVFTPPPVFAVFGDAKIPDAWKKSKKSVIVTPFFVCRNC